MSNEPVGYSQESGADLGGLGTGPNFGVELTIFLYATTHQNSSYDNNNENFALCEFPLLYTPRIFLNLNKRTLKRHSVFIIFLSKTI